MTPQAGRKGLRILLADDAQAMRMLVELHLKGTPHTLALAEDGRRAVDIFAAESFDLVLMDMEMPVMDGRAAAQAIRAMERERGLAPVAMAALTGDADPESRRRCLDAGCTEFLAKPLKKNELLALLDRLAARPG